MCILDIRHLSVIFKNYPNFLLLVHRLLGMMSLKISKPRRKALVIDLTDEISDAIMTKSEIPLVKEEVDLKKETLSLLMNPPNDLKRKLNMIACELEDEVMSFCMILRSSVKKGRPV